MFIRDGKTSGVSCFDPELGLVIGSNMNQAMTLLITVPMKVHGTTTSQTMTDLLHQAIAIKLVSVK